MKWHSSSGRFEGKGRVRKNEARAAFTLIELVVVVAMLALVALVSMPAGASARDHRGQVCLENKAQLIRAWILFAADNDGRLPGNIHGGLAQESAPNAQTFDPSKNAYQQWASGWIDFNLTMANTNRQLIADGRYSSLAPYTKSNAVIFKCPFDLYQSAQQRQRGWRDGRARSVSMGAGIGEGPAETGPFDQQYLHVRKMSEFKNPGPADCYVFIDEHADSINDPAFWSPTGSGNALQWVDWPANYHAGGAGFAFADGHAGEHRWQGSVKTLRVLANGLSQSPSVRDAADMRYLQARTPKRLP